MISEIKLTKLNRDEALRYMGYMGALEEEKIAFMDECEEMVLETAIPRYTYRVLDFAETEDGILFPEPNLLLKGNSIKKHLRGCELAVCFAATISDTIDRKMRMLQITDMAKAVAFNSLSSVAVEQVCDKLEEILKGEYPDYYQTFRFGIGYGDLDIAYQNDFIKMLNASKLIGINVGATHMMTPVKSVTAVIGLSKEKITNTNRGCATCSMNKNCTYRKVGGHCSG